METNEVKSEEEDDNEENPKSENVNQAQNYSKHKQFKNYDLSDEDEKKIEEYRNQRKEWVFYLILNSIHFQRK